MIVVIGLLLTLLTLSSTAWPQPASLSSTSVTPPSVMNTATLPPLNAAFPGEELVRTYRLSLSFTMSITFGPAAGGCCAAIDNVPAASTTPSKTLRFISKPPEKETLHDTGSQNRARDTRARCGHEWLADRPDPQQPQHRLVRLARGRQVHLQ